MRKWKVVIFFFRLFSVSRYYKMLSVACCAYSSLCRQKNLLWAILTTHAVWKSQAKNLNIETKCALWTSGGQDGTDTFETTSKRSTCAAWGLRHFHAAVPSRDPLAGNAASAGAGMSCEGARSAGSGSASSGRNCRLCFDGSRQHSQPTGFYWSHTGGV